MKKFYALTLALICSTLAVLADGYDVIIKTNSEKVVAFIQEVSSTEIRYKKANNPDGPTFVLSTEEVSAIVYANGDVQSIEHKVEQKKVVYNPYDLNANIPENERLVRTGKNEYVINGQKYNTRELKFYLQRTCPQAYNYYNNCVAMETSGWCLFGVGWTTVAAGIAYSYLTGSYNWKAITAAICTSGGALVAGSIPLIVCGNVYKKRVDDFYNQRCASRMAFQPELKLTSGPNGLGFAIAW